MFQEINTSMIGGGHSLYTPAREGDGFARDVPKYGMSQKYNNNNTNGSEYRNNPWPHQFRVGIMGDRPSGVRIMYDNVLSNLGFIVSSKANVLTNRLTQVQQQNFAEDYDRTEIDFSQGISSPSPKLPDNGTKIQECSFKHPLYTDKGTTNLYNMGGYYSRGVVAFIVNTGILHTGRKTMQELGLEEDVNTTSDRAMDTLWQHMQTTTIQQRQGKSGIRPNVVEGVVFGGGSKRKNKTRKHKNKKSKRNYRQIGNKSRKNRRKTKRNNH